MAQPSYKDKTPFHLIKSDSQSINFIALTYDEKLFLYKHNFKYPFLQLNQSNNLKVTALCFLDADTIICGDNDGNIEFASLCRNSFFKTINIFSKAIGQIIKIPNTNYIIIHANTNTMAIVDAYNYKIIHRKYREFKARGRDILFIDNENLKVTLNNSNTMYLNLPSSSSLESLILHNSIKEAFSLIDQEPILKNTLVAKNLEEDFNQVYKQALDVFSVGEEVLANSLLDIYKDIPSKKESLKLLYKSFEEYKRFQTFYKEKKYILCYAISLKYTPLKLTQEYINMELRWQKLFKIAQKEVDNDNLQGAKKILSEYITINSKRTEIQEMLLGVKQKKVLNKLETLQSFYEVENFFSCYEYIDIYPTLYHSQLGKYLQKHYVKLIYNCENYAVDGDTKSIIATLGELIKLTQRKDRVENLLKISFLVRIQKQLLIGDFNTAKRLIYSYIDTFNMDEKINNCIKDYKELCGETLAITLSNEVDWIDSILINS